MDVQIDDASATEEQWRESANAADQRTALERWQQQLKVAWPPHRGYITYILFTETFLNCNPALLLFFYKYITNGVDFW